MKGFVFFIYIFFMSTSSPTRDGTTDCFRLPTNICGWCNSGGGEKKCFLIRAHRVRPKQRFFPAWKINILVNWIKKTFYVLIMTGAFESFWFRQLVRLQFIFLSRYCAFLCVFCARACVCLCLQKLFALPFKFQQQHMQLSSRGRMIPSNLRALRHQAKRT